MSDFPGPIGLGETREEVQAAVAAHASMLVLGLKAGETLIIECREDDKEMFRIQKKSA